jgi:hypothetical protein
MLDFNEYFSDFANVRHNDWATLLVFYGVMKYVAPLQLFAPCFETQKS